MIYFGEDKMPDFCNRRYPYHYATALNLLMKMGIEVSRVNILAIGEYENYKGEVLAQEPKAATPLTRETPIVLKIGCQSAVDILPYQFFYGFGGKPDRRADWELRSRQLLAPFDAAAARHEALARYLTLRYSFGVIDEEHLERYLKLFDFTLGDGQADLHERVIWASMLPGFHLWAGDPERVAGILGTLFGFRFRIVENVVSRHVIPEDARYRLGSKSGRLGRESIVGRSFTEYDSTYRVVISGISRREVAAFVPGRPLRKKLESVLAMCMPNNLGYRISFDVPDGATIIGRKAGSAYLGYGTHLKPGRMTATKAGGNYNGH